MYSSHLETTLSLWTVCIRKHHRNCEQYAQNSKTVAAADVFFYNFNGKIWDCNLTDAGQAGIICRLLLANPELILGIVYWIIVYYIVHRSNAPQYTYHFTTVFTSVGPHTSSPPLLLFCWAINWSNQKLSKNLPPNQGMQGRHAQNDKNDKQNWKSINRISNWNEKQILWKT